ncbi:hypothetical protein X927_00540 [Petrotoga mexicana DSM 14811]|uniref:Uncharacterized protein n=1 Tax=Petrotoga mexicana DSM 14811 TaxID=1122954 RepID=A0A2K1PFK0_9BACT|nr:hypothetical protein [Petrotoga mexicana]PNS01581.1 hypothetical protein X927_00540 [Petrotoga mexicana DSM 14811]
MIPKTELRSEEKNIERVVNMLYEVDKHSGIPSTYALSALRKSLLTGATFVDVKNEIIVLIIMSLLTIPLGLLLFRFGFNKARETGSLIEY